MGIAYVKLCQLTELAAKNMSRLHTHLHARRWAAVRRQVFKRDGYRCRKCGRAGRLEADHVVPLNRGGAPLDVDNVQTLCRSCHFQKTGGENSSVTPEQRAWRELLAAMVKTG